MTRLGSISSILNPAQRNHDAQAQDHREPVAPHPHAPDTNAHAHYETENIPIEPSLLAMSANSDAHPQPQPPGHPDDVTDATDPRPYDQAERSKTERRAQLAREAQAMREMLRAKEREIAELEMEGEADGIS